MNHDFILDTITDYSYKFYGLITNHKQFFGLITKITNFILKQ